MLFVFALLCTNVKRDIYLMRPNLVHQRVSLTSKPVPSSKDCLGNGEIAMQNLFVESASKGITVNKATFLMQAIS